jgi:hypothetical protein
MLITHWWSQGGHVYVVYEWDGQKFRDLLVPDSSGEVFVNASGETHYEDVDGDGIDEVISNSGLPTWSIYRDGLPWRDEKSYFKWNGQNYVFQKKEMTRPEYRFQVIQDGDQMLWTNNYTLAVSLYQTAIFSDTLEWWSPERLQFLQAVWDSSYSGDATPIPPNPNPNEYYQLAAYSRFRLMQIYLLQGYEADAKTVFETLQAKFPKSNAGYPYAEMAALFWNEYQTSHDIAIACKPAQKYVEAHPEILTPLGSDYHGWQSHNYKAVDVCRVK